MDHSLGFFRTIIVRIRVGVWVNLTLTVILIKLRCVLGPASLVFYEYILNILKLKVIQYDTITTCCLRFIFKKTFLQKNYNFRKILSTNVGIPLRYNLFGI